MLCFLSACVYGLCKDREQWEKLSTVIGQSCVLLSDATYKPQGPPVPGATGYLLKHINEMTVSDLIRITSEQQGSASLRTHTRVLI